ncbi:hypothetical protein IF1G_10245 [Cordyceps javanica]|uniref:Uncharacterized protein n=1 Tax=Cordyceps javanica TaxID=43265 RepID=A0A545UNI0_9HYPO|nr:hypothetical protein IF1G_10245 [Cordyceps javanica]
MQVSDKDVARKSGIVAGEGRKHGSTGLVETRWKQRKVDGRNREPTRPEFGWHECCRFRNTVVFGSQRHKVPTL